MGGPEHDKRVPFAGYTMMRLNELLPAGTMSHHSMGSVPATSVCCLGAFSTCHAAARSIGVTATGRMPGLAPSMSLEHLAAAT